MGTHVWGAGGSRRGRRISMDNPLISPWMQNTTNTNPTNAPLRPRVPPQLPPIPDQAAIYQVLKIFWLHIITESTYGIMQLLILLLYFEMLLLNRCSQKQLFQTRYSCKNGKNV